MVEFKDIITLNNQSLVLRKFKSKEEAMRDAIDIGFECRNNKVLAYSGISGMLHFPNTPRANKMKTFGINIFSAGYVYDLFNHEDSWSKVFNEMMKPMSVYDNVTINDLVIDVLFTGNNEFAELKYQDHLNDYKESKK